MNQPADETSGNPSESPFMGPAVPPRTPAADARDELAEPLAPFFGGAGTTEDDDSADEIPWLVSREEAGRESPPRPLVDEPDYLGGVPEVEIDAEPDIVSFESLEPDALEEAPASTPEPPGAGGLNVDDWESALAAAPEPQPEQRSQSLPRELHIEQAGGFREAGSAIAHDVADRLERIAHSLRVRAPNELLSSAGDPLEILVIGYVLGASHAAGRSAGEHQHPTL